MVGYLIEQELDSALPTGRLVAALLTRSHGQLRLGCRFLLALGQLGHCGLGEQQHACDRDCVL